MSKPEIAIFEVKKYNAPVNRVVTYNGKPVALARSARRAGLIAAYLDGAEIELNDKRLVKILDRAMEGEK
ncbi:hypothetical protein [Lacticaseibacillus suibinensis]|uniref:hypothetical protein n=1 Tax=Lacticaseibacillus suibinensis TaxID=2486011 RepID=UPI0019431D86|nr:hypothetical protein [Lacticaseibacillus suibinensis]